MSNTFTKDDVVAALARRPNLHLFANAAAVDRRVVEAAVDGDPDALSDAEATRLGGVLGLGNRVLEVPAGKAPDRGRIVEAARRIVAAEDAADEADASWVRRARAAGVDVEQAYGIRAA